MKEHMEEMWIELLRSHNIHLRFPFLVNTSFPNLTSYLPSLSQAPGCPHLLCAETQVHLGQLCIDHLPSTARSGDEKGKMTMNVLTPFLPHSSLFYKNSRIYLVLS